MTKRTAPQYGPGTGPGRRTTPPDVYLRMWRHVAKDLRAGMSTKAIIRKHGTCAETIRRVRRLLVDTGWTPPRIVPKGIVKHAQPEARDSMTKEQRLRKHAKVVRALLAGKTQIMAAKAGGVTISTVRMIRYLLVQDGRLDES